MLPKVIEVQPLDRYQLQLHFDNSEVRIFNVMPYLDKGIFSQLKSVDKFCTVKLFFGGIQWEDEQDFSRDTLYLLSEPMAV
jgi:Protein of unknown function (DUF2442)